MLTPKSNHISYYPQLDSLRVVAVAMTILAHYWPYDIPYMWYGVRIFFSLSGFLITTILINSFRSSDSRAIVYKNFFIRRILRLLPIYYLFLLVFYLSDVLDVLMCWDFNATNYFFTYTANIYFHQIGGLKFGGWFSHLWTLSVEEQFYIFWPLIVMFFHDRGLLLVMFGLSIFSMYFIIATRIDPESILLLSNLHYLCIGGILAFVYLNSDKTKSVLKNNKNLLIFISTLFLFTALFYFNSSIYREFCLVCFMFCLINQCVFGWDGILGLFFKSPKIQQIGVVSYGIYLFHMPIPPLVRAIFGVFINEPLNQWIEIGLSILVTYVLARFSFQFIEKPFLQLKDKFQ
jgi:peptidoglycan/LPS O-acetylase OafA/YrhL